MITQKSYTVSRGTTNLSQKCAECVSCVLLTVSVHDPRDWDLGWTLLETSWVPNHDHTKPHLLESYQHTNSCRQTVLLLLIHHSSLYRHTCINSHRLLYQADHSPLFHIQRGWKDHSFYPRLPNFMRLLLDLRSIANKSAS